jgi:nucleotide-binding universal stress UspA family protein
MDYIYITTYKPAMRTVLIPVDFSAAADNAIQYTAGLIHDMQVDRVILLNSYFVSMYTQLLPASELVQFTSEDMSQERHEIEVQLQEIGAGLDRQCNSLVQIDTQISELPLLRAIKETVQMEKVELLILGNDDQTRSNESLIARQLIAITKASRIPVLIVPADVTYQRIRRALIPCNFATISRLSFLNTFKQRELCLQAQLLLLNINPTENLVWKDPDQLHYFKKMLQDYDLEVHNSDSRNTLKAFLEFADQHAVQMIISLPGKESFFHGLTPMNITEAISSNSRQPVLLLKS